ncbi:uncharacterized protein LTR77_008941 [Saxophila tyrrhenica]|uniref:F-box domain-containing protein n=1 Tax=Saxophila tyrrhenica TaxID=1690608 RepID=A0AAV9P310_9PEZI|nr:hypothetical protein LTR77_008941 [Saxophila tyrrhenica]
MDIGVETPSLSPELISLICSFIDTRKTLYNISVCSNTFYDAAVPYLYSTIDLRASDAKPVGRHTDWFGLRNLISLFLSKPKLALYVRGISIRGISDLSDGSRLSMAEPPMAVPHHDVPSNLDPSWVPYVLSANVEYHELVRQCNINMKSALHMLETTTPSRIHAELRDISCICLPDSHHSPKHFFEHSSVKRLFLNNIRSDLSQRYWRTTRTMLRDLESSSSNVEQIQLFDCCFDDADVTDILRVPRALTSFTYEIGKNDSLREAVSDASRQTLLHGLERHVTTLRSLCVDSQHGCDEVEEVVARVTPFWGLRRFEKLAHLRMAAIFMMGRHRADMDILANLLPSSIETLEITKCSEYFGNSPDQIFWPIQELLRMKASFPRLSSIAVGVSLDFLLETVEMEEEGKWYSSMFRRAKEVGVTITLLVEREGSQSFEFKEAINRDIAWAEIRDGGIPMDWTDSYQRVNRRVTMECMAPSGSD